MRYTKNEFSGNYIPTIGADFTTVPLKINQDQDIIEFNNDNDWILNHAKIQYDEYKELNSRYDNENNIYVWDLAGQTLFNKVRTFFMAQAFLTVIVVDLNRLETFDIDSWVEDTKIYSPQSEIMLAGNKSDLIDLENDEIAENIKNLENKYKTPLIITSAKDGSGVKELFTLMKLNVMKRLNT